MDEKRMMRRAHLPIRQLLPYASSTGNVYTLGI